MDALDLLIADHNRVRGLFARFEQAKEKDDQVEMVELAGKIFDELTVHTTIEEDVFYPAVHDTDEDISETVDEGLQEHHVAKVLMEELGQVEAGSDEWLAKMAVLIENVEHHAEEEEEELFPQLRKVFGDSRLEAMGDKLQAAKQRRGASPVPESAVLKDLTREELYEKAQELDIPGRSEMTKEQLIEALSNR
jgi:hemerythrin superfamily protein